MHGLLEAILYLIGLVLAIIGSISLLYALYSLFVKGFSSSMRFYCFVVCITCYGIAGFFLFVLPFDNSEELKTRYAGTYQLTNNGKTYLLELRKDGTFDIDTTLFPAMTGTWEATEPDAVFIDLLEGGNRFTDFAVRQSGDTILLLMQDHYEPQRAMPVFKKW